MKTTYRVLTAILLLLPTVVFAQGFMAPPLSCGDPNCNFQYDRGVYTYKSMNTVLDHSLKQNANGLWQYGTLSSGGGNATIIAFNSETANGSPKPGKEVCISGTILLKPTPSSPASTSMTNTSGCGVGYVSYDEHPGYDYRAAYGNSGKSGR